MQRTQGPELKVALLPQGKDPDQVIHDNPAEWESLLDNAIPWWEFWFQAEATRHDLSSSQGKALLTDSLFPVISSIENPYEQERLFSRLAELLGVSNQTLIASVGLPRPKNLGRRASPARKATVSAFRTASHDSLEEFTLALLLQNPSLRDQGLGLTIDHFSQSPNRELFSNWFELFSIEVLPDKVSEHLQDYLSNLMQLPIPESTDSLLGEALLQCINRLEERKLREIKREESLILGEQWLEGDNSNDFSSQQDLSSTEALRRLFLNREPDS
jgi:DNA primase